MPTPSPRATASPGTRSIRTSGVSGFCRKLASPKKCRWLSSTAMTPSPQGCNEPGFYDLTGCRRFDTSDGQQSNTLNLQADCQKLTAAECFHCTVSATVPVSVIPLDTPVMVTV